MIDFLIIYEFRQREIESIILIGNELKKRGYTVEYLYLYEKDRAFRSKKYFNRVKAVLTPGLYNNENLANTVYYLAGKPEKVINFRWEQINMIRTEGNSCSNIFPQDFAKYAIHLCWGKKPQEDLLSVGITDEKLPICGPIHMDFLRPMLTEYYVRREELFSKYKINFQNKTVLFVSSFAISSMTDRQLRFNENIEGVKEYYELGAKSFEEIMKWVGCLLKDNKDINFVYRPHPVENDSKRLSEMQKEFKNFHIISEHSVKQWILTCDIVTTWVSTSIAEAYFAKKPCLILRPVTIPYEQEMAIYKGATTIDSFEEFIAEVNGGDIKMPLLKESVVSYYDVNDDKPSFIRASDILEDIMNKEKYNFLWDKEFGRYCKKQNYKRFLTNLAKYFYRFILEIALIFRNMKGISFCVKIEDRADLYMVHKLRIKNNCVPKKEVEQLSEKLSRFTHEWRVKS